MINLKPCPFCADKMPMLFTTINQKYFVECVMCGAGFDKPYLWCETKEQAAAKWNARKRWILFFGGL